MLCFVHADSQPPPTLVAEIRRTLRPPRTVLGGFRTLICSDDGRMLRFMTTHHLLKTHYLPAVVRPLAYLRHVPLACDVSSEAFRSHPMLACHEAIDIQAMLLPI